MGIYSDVNGKIVATGFLNKHFVKFTEAIIEKYKEEQKDYGAWWIQEITSTMGENGELEVTVLYGNSGKAYEIKEQVQEVVSILASTGLVANGEIHVFTMETFEFDKVTVVDNVVTKYKGEVTVSFADGKELKI